MVKSIPKPSAALDTVLMLLLAVEVAVIGYTLLQNDREMLAYLLALLVVVAAAVAITKRAFAVGGGWFSRTFLQHLGDPLKKAVTMKKWCDQSWQLVIHASMSLFELVVLADETWWHDTTTLWNQGTPTGAFPEHKFRTKLLYITQLAIWIYTAFSCKFLEEIRKDYVIMMAHHVVTIALVTGSYMLGHLPGGIIVLVLHDLSDIPLDLLKMANYLKLEGANGLFVCEALFAVVFAGWFYLRLYLFPAKLLYSTFVESRDATLPPAIARDPLAVFTHPNPPGYVLINGLFAALYCLHIWWGFLLLRLLVGTLTKGAHATGKDEYEGMSDSEGEHEKDD
ncbi:hypothetical protein PybrP1_009769 [[Pythium] brassicae (nom. inval.)]|nr:hypothetical protein PybrP1_009769 [[Pythium] brassicae (nom. inval.)]